MAALWPQFISIVGNYLDDPSEGKTHEETAEKIASEYHKAVKAAKTSLKNLLLFYGVFLCEFFSRRFCS